jgi:hypothetical protein
MREINSSPDANLVALSEINHSLRQQVIELVLTIAAMRENADLPSATLPHGMGETSRGMAKMKPTFRSTKSTYTLKNKARSQQRN